MLTVYKIQDNQNSENFYIGSTKNLNMRIKKHKQNMNCVAKSHFKLYRYVKEHGGWDNFDISILAMIDDIDIGDLCSKEQLEQRYIDKYKPLLNERNAYLTPEQKRDAHKIYNKNYGNHDFHCQCGKVLKWKNKSKHFHTQRHKDFLSKQTVIAFY